MRRRDIPAGMVSTLTNTTPSGYDPAEGRAYRDERTEQGRLAWPHVVPGVAAGADGEALEHTGDDEIEGSPTYPAREPGGSVVPACVGYFSGRKCRLRNANVSGAAESQESQEKWV